MKKDSFGNVVYKLAIYAFAVYGIIHFIKHW